MKNSVGLHIVEHWMILLSARCMITSDIVVWQVLMHRTLNGGAYDYVGNFQVQIKKGFLECVDLEFSFSMVSS